MHSMSDDVRPRGSAKQTRSVVITGRGAVTSLGEGADAFLDALYERRSGIADGLGPCADFDPEVAMTAKQARRADRFTQFAAVAADQACAEAGLPDGIEPEPLCALVGTGIRAAWRPDGSGHRGAGDARARMPQLDRTRRSRGVAPDGHDDDAQRRCGDD